ncbi:hypothetical protein G0U57_013638, partial [Chelydra serpentina]
MACTLKIQAQVPAITWIRNSLALAGAEARPIPCWQDQRSRRSRGPPGQAGTVQRKPHPSPSAGRRLSPWDLVPSAGGWIPSLPRTATLSPRCWAPGSPANRPVPASPSQGGTNTVALLRTCPKRPARLITTGRILTPTCPGHLPSPFRGDTARPGLPSGHRGLENAQPRKGDRPQAKSPGLLPGCPALRICDSSHCGCSPVTEQWGS